MIIDEKFVENFILIADKHQVSATQLSGVFSRAGYNPKNDPSSAQQSIRNYFQPFMGIDSGSKEFKNIINEIKTIPQNVKAGFRPVSYAEIELFLRDIGNL